MVKKEKEKICELKNKTVVLENFDFRRAFDLKSTLTVDSQFKYQIPEKNSFIGFQFFS